jgi:hypothetical protein
MPIIRILFSLTRLTGITVLVLLSRSLFAQTERCSDLTTVIKQHAAWDPADFVLEKLRANRVVMVEDAGHGDPLYYKVIISSLNKWISKHEQWSFENQTRDLPKKLFLALEIDSIGVNRLKRYFQSGNGIETITPMNFWGDQFTTGTLEFYADLRTLRGRIDAYNHLHSGDNQISFDIIGPEKVLDLSNWTSEKRDNFFVFERDEYSSTRIKELLEAAPDAKILVYYGGAHLQRGSVPKEAGNVRASGHFLAHYLSESFGSRGGVYVCSQVDAFQSGWLDEAVMKIGKTFAVDHSIFTGRPVNADAWIPPSDGAIYEFASPRKPTHISRVLSENLVDYILEHIDGYTDSTNEFYRGTVQTFFYYLCTAAVRDWNPSTFRNTDAVDSTIKAWKEWRKSTTLDIVGGLSSLEYFKRYVERIRSTADPVSTQYQRRLAQFIGFKVWFHSGASPQVRADSTWRYILKYRKPIVIENLIHLLWVASKGENDKALAILKEETGENFTRAKEWSTWWEAQKMK